MTTEPAAAIVIEPAIIIHWHRTWIIRMFLVVAGLAGSFSVGWWAGVGGFRALVLFVGLEARQRAGEAEYRSWFPGRKR